MNEVTCVLDAKSILGEGALWDVQAAVLYWVDIKRREIHRFDPASGRDACWSTPEAVGSLAVREAGGLVVALASGFHFFDPATGSSLPPRPAMVVGPAQARQGAPRRGAGSTRRSWR